MKNKFQISCKMPFGPQKRFSTIQYVKGDVTTVPYGSGAKILLNYCNDLGSWNTTGLMDHISFRFGDSIQKAYQQWFARRKDFGLGKVQLLRVRPNLWVANIIGQRGARSTCGIPPIRYFAIEQALFQVAAHARRLNASIHTVRFGGGRAGGDWKKISRIFRKVFHNGHAVYVYKKK